jgi:hypothetical protein
MLNRIWHLFRGDALMNDGAKHINLDVEQPI